MIMSLYEEKLLKVSDHRAKFGSHRHCDNEDITVLICHAISLDQVTKRSQSIMGKSSSKLVTNLPSLVGIETAVVEI